jgi:hypothetical protein
MIRNILVLCLILFTVACSRGKYRAAVNSWMGHPRDKLITTWGAPTSIVPLKSGGEVIEYVRSATSTSSGLSLPVTMAGGATAYVNTGGGTSTRFCKTTFITNSSGLIVSWRYEGNGC